MKTFIFNPDLIKTNLRTQERILKALSNKMKIVIPLGEELLAYLPNIDQYNHALWL